MEIKDQRYNSVKSGDYEGHVVKIENGDFFYRLNSVSDEILRDYFAGLAMSGLTSSGLFNLFYKETYEKVPEYAYMLADGMMKARKEEN